MPSKDSTTTDEPRDTLPFGTISEGTPPKGGTSKGARGSKKGSSDRRERSAEQAQGAPPDAASQATDGAGRDGAEAQPKAGKGPRGEKGQKKTRNKKAGNQPSDGQGEQTQPSGNHAGTKEPRGGNQQPRRRSGRRRNRHRGQEDGRGDTQVQRKGRGQQQGHKQRVKQKQGGEGAVPQTGSGMFLLEKGGYGVLRSEAEQFLPSKEDIYVPKRLIQKDMLQDGAMVEGRLARGQKHKFQLVEVNSVDGEDPQHWKNIVPFKNLTSIDPDFHYATGDVIDNVSMRIVDLLCPVGRGQRGLLVAPPRSGKTTLMREFAQGIEEGYPDVHLMVLLVDERPEEATEWVRSVKRGKVFVSTADESYKNHIQLAEAVWKRCTRLVELGEDVVLLLDSITRLARAYNHQSGSGRTMSGGLDSRAMERPRKIFGSARNTESAGSLTILGTTLIETGSRMDQMVFEEFKGTGNMELVLARRLADRRVFPAIDIERSGTRKEEKLVGMRRLKLIHTLRRVLLRMNFAEAMELLITRLEDVDKTDDFLKRFEVDPEAE